MSDHYDRLENRPSAARETTLFRDLRHVLATSKPRIAALRSQLRGIDVAGLKGRADLARIPIVGRAGREPDETPATSSGGLAAMRSSGLKQAFMVQATGGALLCPEGQAKDWWGMGRALHAAGLRRGTLVLNCFPYDLEPHGHMVASGAAAVGAPVVPAGAAGLESKAEVVRRLRPGFFCGSAPELRALLDLCAERGIDAGCIGKALVMGALTAGLRHELVLRGVAARTAFALPAFGVVAYESDTPDALTLNEGLVCEIVDGGTGQPVARGQPGAIVLTRIDGNYPLLRHAIGASSAVLTQPATCGRTNMRIKPPQPLTDRTPADLLPAGTSSEVGRRTLAAHLRDIAVRHPKLGRMRLDTRHRRDEEAPHLTVEHGGGDAPAAPMAETLRIVASLRGTFEFVAPGTLGDLDTLIDDEGVDERRRK